MKNEIYAFYNDEIVRVYQAFNHDIADEVLESGNFGKSFNLNRMTWIKTSFLWMMYRSSWGTMKNQERILQIDISRDFFNEILEESVLTKYNDETYETKDEWKENLNNSDVRCQFDPDRTIYGEKMKRSAIQLGIKNDFIKEYVSSGIISIIDITENVHQLKLKIDSGMDVTNEIPTESLLDEINDNVIKKLNIISSEI